VPETHLTSPAAPSDAVAEIGLIGGSGFYRLADDLDEVVVATPFGSPSDALAVGSVAGRRIAFLPRHGRDHRFPPHRINYRANLWALRSLGVRQVLAPCAVGGLHRGLGPGHLVVPDQLVDRTSGRAQTYFDDAAVHVAMAEPYCPRGRAAVTATAADSGWQVAGAGTLVVIEGPRFSTRAESRWFADNGWTVVGMTGHPEAALARELALCYTSICLVTDLDAGVGPGEGVTHSEVLAAFAGNLGRLRTLMTSVVAALSNDRSWPCPHALDGLDLPFALP
jgi:5'-methylthioadenosine phosphorylase